MESKIEASGPVYFIASQVVFFQNKIMLFSYQIENLAQMKLHLHLESQRTECISKHTKMFVLSSLCTEMGLRQGWRQKAITSLKRQNPEGIRAPERTGHPRSDKQKGGHPHSVPTKKSEG